MQSGKSHESFDYRKFDFFYCFILTNYAFRKDAPDVFQFLGVKFFPRVVLLTVPEQIEQLFK